MCERLRMMALPEMPTAALLKTPLTRAELAADVAGETTESGNVVGYRLDKSMASLASWTPATPPCGGAAGKLP